ncbi:hypothetical protein [Saccharopolyspora sp. NPDC049426]|uniref:hypothetical protein n=1 Tax=Saccharopolyspora sp. NPDC049426 TaxID=3155652 RepID=UPI00344053DB
MTTAEQVERLTVRVARWRRIMALCLSPVLGALTFFGFPVPQSDGPGYAFRGVLTVLVLGLVWVLMLRTRLLLTADEISQTAFGAPRKRVALAEVAEVLRVRVVVTGEGGAKTWFFLVDRDRRRLLAIREETYDGAELAGLLERLGRPVVELRGELSAKELERRRPGLVPWHLRHPVLIGLTAGFAIVALAAVVAIVLSS